MESIMNFVAEWFSLGEMKVLQGVSVPMSVRVKEWQYKDVSNDIDDLKREDLSEGWQKHVSEVKKVLPCEHRCLVVPHEGRCRPETAVHSLFCEMRRL